MRDDGLINFVSFSGSISHVLEWIQTILLTNPIIEIVYSSMPFLTFNDAYISIHALCFSVYMYHICTYFRYVSYRCYNLSLNAWIWIIELDVQSVVKNYNPTHVAWAVLHVIGLFISVAYQFQKMNLFMWIVFPVHGYA